MGGADIDRNERNGVHHAFGETEAGKPGEDSRPCKAGAGLAADCCSPSAGRSSGLGPVTFLKSPPPRGLCRRMPSLEAHVARGARRDQGCSSSPNMNCSVLHARWVPCQSEQSCSSRKWRCHGPGQDLGLGEKPWSHGPVSLLSHVQDLPGHQRGWCLHRQVMRTNGAKCGQADPERPLPTAPQMGLKTNTHTNTEMTHGSPWATPLS